MSILVKEKIAEMMPTYSLIPCICNLLTNTLLVKVSYELAPFIIP